MRFLNFSVLVVGWALIAQVVLVKENLESLMTEWGRNNQLTIYLSDQTSDAQKTNTENIRGALTETGLIRDVKLVTKDEAIQEFSNSVFNSQSASIRLTEDSELLKLIPASLEVSLADKISAEEQEATLKALSEKVAKLAGVDQVSYGQEWLSQFSKFIMAIKTVLQALIVIFGLTSLFLVGNAVQATISSQRNRIEVLELIGATPAMIRKPFIMQGLRWGALAATVAVAGSFALTVILRQRISYLHGIHFLSLYAALGLIVTAAVLGSIASYLSIRQLNTGWAASKKLASKISVALAIIVSASVLPQKTFAKITTQISANPARQISADKDHAGIVEKLNAAEEFQRRILADMYSINKRQKKILKERSAYEAHRLILEANLKDLSQRVLDLEKQQKERRSELQNRLALIYRVGKKGVARILFSSSNSSQLDRQTKIMSLIAQADLEQIRQFNDDQKILEQQKKKFELKLAHYKKLEIKIQDREKNLKLENDRKSALLAQVREKKKKVLNKLTELKSLVAQRAFFEKKGELVAPVTGSVVKKFGLSRDLENNLAFANHGVFISTPKEASVHAIYDGTVALAQEIAGYGNTVIVDHGDHYYSVYSQMDHLNVREGDHVKAAAAIASVAQNELYFEIRHFSEPSDPQKWVKGL